MSHASDMAASKTFVYEGLTGRDSKAVPAHWSTTQNYPLKLFSRMWLVAMSFRRTRAGPALRHGREAPRAYPGKFVTAAWDDELSVLCLNGTVNQTFQDITAGRC